MAVYVPRVLVCGDVEEFRKKIGDRPVEVIAQIKFVKTGDDIKLFLGEKLLTAEDILQMLDDTAEYLIFTDAVEFYFCYKKFSSNVQIMSVETFAKKFHDGFFSYKVLGELQVLLNQKNYSGRVLDFDALLAKSDLHTREIFTVELDALGEKIYPIMENFYGKIYRSFDEVKFHHFDALIFSKERTPAEFIDVLIETDALTENIFVFVRKDTALEDWLAANENIFAKIERFNVFVGMWYLLKKNVPPVDVGVYVVTHKDAKLENLPEGYKFIHAGKTLAKKDFGYHGDDTGDNISELNPFLDEVTALYWIWKNTNHAVTGLCHYRRFFSTYKQKTFDSEKILSAEEILNILNDYDIIVNKEGMTARAQRDMMILSTGSPDLVRVTEKIIRDYLRRAQPDYLDAFDDMLNSFMLFPNGMIVTRRNIFNDYCEWLFSFMLGATEEVRDKIEIQGKSLLEMGHAYSRIAGFFAERMLTVWLMKNHLKIKELPTMFREHV